MDFLLFSFIRASAMDGQNSDVISDNEQETDSPKNPEQ